MAGSQIIEQQWVYSTSESGQEAMEAGQAVRRSKADELLNVMAKIKTEYSVDIRLDLK